MRIQIAENIKNFRIASGYTQCELAILLSVSPQAVSRWEKGQAFPDITLLPLLAKYLNVTVDEIMGSEGQRSKCLKKEIFERETANIDDESQRLENELRILEIYEELAHTELPYLINYFRNLMNIKSHKRFILNDLESRIESARQMIRDRLKISNMRDRVTLLSAVAAFEDEENLTSWADEYQLPEYIRANFWDELLLTRYTREQNVNKLSSQNQKILYAHIKNTVYYLTDSVPNDMMQQGQDFGNLERYKMALDTLSLYSTQVDDVFIFT
jgi:transcriptional regulator with XRE-family HTH domain